MRNVRQKMNSDTKAASPIVKFTATLILIVPFLIVLLFIILYLSKPKPNIDYENACNGGDFNKYMYGLQPSFHGTLAFNQKNIGITKSLLVDMSKKYNLEKFGDERKNTDEWFSASVCSPNGMYLFAHTSPGSDIALSMFIYKDKYKFSELSDFIVEYYNNNIPGQFQQTSGENIWLGGHK